MNMFSARLDINSVEKISEGKYKIISNVVDNSGNYFATDVSVADVIYADGSSLGDGLLRYKISSIDPETTGATLIATIDWDMDSEIVDPYDGINGVIGERNEKLNTAALTSIFTNMVDEALIANARNYEGLIIGDAIDSKESKLGNPTSDGQVLSSDVDGNRSWVTLPSISDAIDLIKGKANGLAELDENGKLPLSQVPSIAITDVYTVENEAEMLDLGNIGAEKGDIASRLDNGIQYILTGDPTIINDWKPLTQPIPVSSVNGQIGQVILTTTNIDEGLNLYYTDDRVANSPAVKNLENLVNDLPSGDMEKSIYDVDNNGKIDKAEVADVANSIEYENIKNKPSIPTKTSDLEKDDVYDKTEIDGLLINKIDKDSVYTKEEVNTIVNDLPSGDMEKSVYDINNDGKVDKAELADVADIANSIEYENVKNKPNLSTVATSGSYNDLIDKPSIPTKTSDLEKDDVYDKTEIDGLLGNSGLVRYASEGSIILATGLGVTTTKLNNTITFNCPQGVKIVSATIRFTAAEISTGGNCLIDFGTNANHDGTGTNDSYDTVIPPMFQVINDVTASRAYKIAPPPAANINTNAHTLQLTGLTSNIGVIIRLLF